MNTTAIGRAAEARAAEFLQSMGHTILARNWRTRWSEIDIVSSLCGHIHLVEVKFRASSAYGDAASYITPAKMSRMVRAAEAYMAMNRPGGDYQIDVIAITGTGPAARLEYYPNALG